MPGVLHGVARFLAFLDCVSRSCVCGLGCYVWLYGVLCDPTSVRRCWFEKSRWVGSRKSMPGVLHGVARFLAVL